MINDKLCPRRKKKEKKIQTSLAPKLYKFVLFKNMAEGNTSSTLLQELRNSSQMIRPYY